MASCRAGVTFVPSPTEGPLAVPEFPVTPAAFSPQETTSLLVVLAVLMVLLVVLAVGTAMLAGARRRNRVLAGEVARLQSQVARLEEQHGAGPALPRSLGAAERAVKALVETAVKLRSQGVGGLVMSSFDELSRWAMEDRSEIVQMAALDDTVTLFFSDIEDSTALNATLGDEAWVRLLIAHDTQVRAQVERRGGHVVKSIGDGFMVAFSSPEDAVRAGLSIQRSVQSLRGKRLRAIKVRIGIHRGTVIARENDLFGQSVAMAARVAAQAEGGQILVTQPVAEDLRDNERLVLSEREPVELKGFPGAHPLWSVTRAPRS